MPYRHNAVRHRVALVQANDVSSISSLTLLVVSAVMVNPMLM
jgi:hypothetical protein